jgi:hypothetical protein
MLTPNKETACFLEALLTTYQTLWFHSSQGNRSKLNTKLCSMFHKLYPVCRWLIVWNKKQQFIIPISRCQIPCLGVVCGMIEGECDNDPVICILDTNFICHSLHLCN